MECDKDKDQDLIPKDIGVNISNLPQNGNGSTSFGGLSYTVTGSAFPPPTQMTWSLGNGPDNILMFAPGPGGAVTWSIMLTTLNCPNVGPAYLYTLNVTAEDAVGSYPKSADFYRSD
jgi:hypothetical protein